MPFLTLKACFTDAFEAIPYLQNNQIDLLFLDIKMPDISGIEFLNCLQKKPQVVFTTAYSEYAVQGFELDVLDYLLKPFSLARFTKACNKALAACNNGEDFFFLKTGYEDEKVFFDEILFLEAEGNYVAYHLANRPKMLCRQNITEAIGNLPIDKFLRIHRSFVLAIDKVQKIGRQSVWIQNHEIPIGVSYEHVLQELKKK